MRWPSLITAIAVLLLAGAASFGADAAPAMCPPTTKRAPAGARAKPEPDQPLNLFAFALAKRARDTSDTTHYDRTMEAIEASLRLNPGNLGAEKARVWILAGKHDFPEALRARAPADPLLLAVVTDACV